MGCSLCIFVWEIFVYIVYILIYLFVVFLFICSIFLFFCLLSFYLLIYCFILFSLYLLFFILFFIFFIYLFLFFWRGEFVGSNIGWIKYQVGIYLYPCNALSLDLYIVQFSWIHSHFLKLQYLIYHESINDSTLWTWLQNWMIIKAITIWKLTATWQFSNRDIEYPCLSSSNNKIWGHYTSSLLFSLSSIPHDICW